MRDAVFAVLCALALASVGASCWAMTAAPQDGSRCRLVDGGKLPDATGGPAGVCRTIEQTIASTVSTPYQVEVRVLGPSALAATLTTSDSRVLPEHRFASSDRPLAAGSIARFARALARKLAEAEAR